MTAAIARLLAFIALFGGIGLVSSPAYAQSTGAPHVVGLLAQDLQPGLLETFRDELHRLGYVEGTTLRIELRNAGGRSAQLPALAQELLQLKVEVIAAVNTSAALAAKAATHTVPVVILRVADPLKSGLVTSLSHPEGNVTGLSFMPDELGAKGLEMLREVIPNISRVAALYAGDNPGGLIVVQETERRSKQLGLHFVSLPVRGVNELPHAFETAAQAQSQALFVMDDGAITKQRREIVDLATKNRMPIVSIYKDFAQAGGLIAYGPSLSAVYRRAAQYVDRILKGATPRQLPVEQPTKFDLFVNLTTAKALNIAIPQSILLRADEVIE
jgi:putative ABC transport system substrate-binding protein